jgi:hypothetical protein
LVIEEKSSGIGVLVLLDEGGLGVVGDVCGCIGGGLTSLSRPLLAKSTLRCFPSIAKPFNESIARWPES